jgi:putative ATP-dependent endonuclease of OLD family
MPEVATIRKLMIRHFRGFERLDWKPALGMNVILGGGDVGKTTVLDAIALLFSPSNSTTLSEADYWQRDTTVEFEIEAVMHIPASCEISTQRRFSWPWAWNGDNAVMPSINEDGDGNMPIPNDPVYRIRVRGTCELELVWEIVQPNDEADHFSVALRRQIGLVRLSADDRNDRDLRLVYGSALDRLLNDVALRSRIGKQVSELPLHDSLSDNGKSAIASLDERLNAAALPSELKLGLTTSQGLSIGALIGLLAGKDGVSLPLSSWGAGTRRMAALEIATSTEKDASVVIVDEIERGLEPYRLRKLINSLHAAAHQTFVTTHSPVAISCAKEAHLWYLDSVGNIGELPYAKIASQQRRDPETFLAKLAVIAEGATEVGFLRFLLEKAFKTEPLDHGVRVCDGQGNDSTLTLLEALSLTGLTFAGLADNEGRNQGRWAKVKTRLGDQLLQWSEGCTEQRVISEIPDDKLPELLKDSDGCLNGERLRSLADRIGVADKSLNNIQATLTETGKSLRQLIIEAATGNKVGAPVDDEKEWKSHERCWFKSEEGGRELAEKMVLLGAWPKMQSVVFPFVNAILKAAGQPKLEELDL